MVTARRLRWIALLAPLLVGSGAAASSTHSYTDASPWVAPVAWTSPDNLGGSLWTNPSCVVAYAGIVDCFAVGADLHLKQKRWSQSLVFGWNDQLGGPVLAPLAPSCVARPFNRIDCFAVGERQLWRLSWDGNAWRRWESLGAPPAGIATSNGGSLRAPDPECLSAGPDHVECFIQGGDGAMWHRWWDGWSWGGWESLGGVIRARPSCVSRAPGTVDCFVIGSDWALYHAWFDGVQWQGWAGLGSPPSATASRNLLVANPSCVSWAPDRLDCFAVAGDGNLYHRFRNASGVWSGWGNRGGAYLFAASCVAPAPGRIHCAATQSAGTSDWSNILVRQWYTQSSSPWTSLGSMAYSSVPECAVVAPDRVECFALLSNPGGSRLRHFTWTP